MEPEVLLYIDDPDVLERASYAEKRGDSIERQKRVVLEILLKSYPQKFDHDQEIEYPA